MPSTTTPALPAAQVDDPDARCVAIRRQDEIAISVDENGDLVLEQQDGLGNEPAVIIVAQANVTSLIDALLHLAGRQPLPNHGTGPLPFKPTDRTNADRQRRYRERRRNGTAAVTGCVTRTH